ncbi:MAG TPA: hypothetical protein PK637_05655 [Flavobacteriales bacterium]|nr:hypothetical protein [Flavobacteriales bacterium]HRE96230.1 hypothetical protein [Flavobacteriales bacterium]HRJ35418.1 hypothetical protein [Flavobacteriales bacterium]HRJ38401.1 hypothetical protein [Flavobacteriales bacterium]
MMKRLVSFVFTASLVAIVGYSAAQVLNKKADEKPDPRVKAQENATKVTAYKQKSRDNLKPYRYDGTNVTHFSYSGFTQKREIEVLLFNGNEYRLVFNAEGATKPLDIEIYDKPSDNQGRVKLHEVKSVTGQENISIQTDVLNAKYKELKNSKDVVLKRIYVDYIISANDTREPASGFMVLTYGYKNV